MANKKRLDLIDRNELFPNGVFYVCNENPTASLDELLNRIANAKSVDAVEVVHGRWELHGNDDDCGCSYFCSNCHTSYDEDWFYVHDQYRHCNHCPNCGALMDGGTEGGE